MIKKAKNLESGDWIERGNIEYEVASVRPHVENAHEPPYHHPLDDLIVEDVAGAVEVTVYGPVDGTQTFVYRSEEKVETW